MKIENMTEEKVIDIIGTMIEWKLIDPSRLDDHEYIVDRVLTYVRAANIVRDIMKMEKLA